MEDRIEVKPDVHFGKPCIAGTRIPVENVLELLKEGLSFGDIAKDYYTELEHDDIRACIQYAIDLVAVEEVHVATAK